MKDFLKSCSEFKYCTVLSGCKKKKKKRQIDLIISILIMIKTVLD